MYCILPFMQCIYFIFQAKMQIWNSSMKRVLQKFLKLEETSKYELTALWANIAFHILFLVTHSIGAVRIYIQCLHLNYVNRYGYLVQCKYLLPATTHIISSLGDYERLITPATPGPDRVGGCRMIRTHIIRVVAWQVRCSLPASKSTCIIANHGFESANFLSDERENR